MKLWSLTTIRELSRYIIASKHALAPFVSGRAAALADNQSWSKERKTGLARNCSFSRPHKVPRKKFGAA